MWGCVACGALVLGVQPSEAGALVTFSLLFLLQPFAHSGGLLLSCGPWFVKVGFFSSGWPPSGFILSGFDLGVLTFWVRTPVDRCIWVLFAFSSPHLD